MTSNAGASTIKKQKTLGFSSHNQAEVDKNEYEKMKDNIMIELKKQFRPEFLNRIDDIIVFHSLNKHDISQIVKLMCKTLIKRLDEMTIKLEMDEEAIDLIAKEGLDLESVSLPSSNICNNILKTSGCAFSISSNNTTEYGCLLTFSVNCPPSP